jgi:hypothetical protein
VEQLCDGRRVDALLKMTRTALPNVLAVRAIMPTFETATERKALHALYSRIHESNFSHEVLAARPKISQ